MAPYPSSTSYALLGLLSVRSWTTYELAQQVQRSLKWFWPRAERQLYDEPKRLAAHGLADVEERFVGRRRSRDWSITAEGRRALRAWLDAPPEPRTTEFEGMVKVFFAEAGGREQLLTTLRRIEDEAAQRVGEVAALARQASPYPERRHLQSLCLPFQLAQEEAVLGWARWARDQVAGWASAADPGEWDVAGELTRLAERAERLLAPTGQG